MLEPRIGRRGAIGGVLVVREPGVEVIRWSGSEGDRATDIKLDESVLPGVFARGDRLPCLPGLLEWDSDGATHRVEIRLAPDRRPAALVAAVLGEVSREIRAATTLRDVSLVRVEGLERFLAEQRIDGLLDRVGAELFEVCDRPRPKLVAEELWQDLSRVRRPARRAAQALMRNTRYLGHPGRRSGVATPGMPRPERLLTEIVEETFDRYENSFVATLVDEVARRLGGRTEDADSALEALVAGRAELELVRDLGMWHQQDRLRQRLGKAEATVGELAARCAELVTQLRRQERHLRAARASRLFDAVIRSPRVRPPIRPTNLLVHDLNYAPLHDSWVELHKSQEPPEIHPADDDPDLAYARFCAMLLARALDECGFSSDDPWVEPGSGREATWRRRDPGGASWKMVVRAEEEGDLEVVVSRRIPARKRAAPPERWLIAPRFVSVSKDPTGTLERLRTQASVGERRVLWLVPQGPSESTPVGCGVHAPPDGDDGIAVVTPLLFSGVDRVGTWILARTVGETLRAGVALEQCPVCLGERVEGSPDDRLCLDCKAAWGSVTCRACRSVIPTLVPRRPDSTDLQILAPDESEGEIGWLRFVDRVLGRDRVVEVEASREDPGSFRWRCPSCGAV